MQSDTENDLKLDQSIEAATIDMAAIRRDVSTIRELAQAAYAGPGADEWKGSIAVFAIMGDKNLEAAESALSHAFRCAARAKVCTFAHPLEARRQRARAEAAARSWVRCLAYARRQAADLLARVRSLVEAPR